MLFTAILRDITERVQAEEAVKQSMRQVQALSEQVMKVQQRERDALARELHDELGQSLTALKVNLQMLEPFCTDGEAEDYLTEALMIAGRLNLSVKTVESHRTLLTERLGIHDVAGLTLFAARAGLVAPDS